MPKRSRFGGVEEITGTKRKNSKLGENIGADDGTNSEAPDAPHEEKTEVDKHYQVTSSLKLHYEYLHTAIPKTGCKTIVMMCKHCNKPRRGPVGNIFNFKKHLQVAHSVEIVDSFQPKLDTFVVGQKNAKLPLNDPLQLKFDKSTAKAIAIDGLPLDLTSGDGFRELIQTANPKLTIKSRRTMTRRIEEMATEIKTKSDYKELESLSKERIHPIVDIWSSRSNESVLGIKIQYLNDELQMVNKLIAFEEFNEEHNAQEIQKKVREVFQSRGLKAAQVGSIVSDRAENMLAAFNMDDFFTNEWDLIEDSVGEEPENLSGTGLSGSDDDPENSVDEGFQVNESTSSQSDEVVISDVEREEVGYGWDHHGCLSHRLQNVINASIKKDKDVQQIIGVTNSIVRFFRRSTKWMSRLKSSAGKVVLGIGQTRWNALYTGMARICEDNMFSHIEEILRTYNVQNKKNPIHIPTLVERKKMQEVLGILLPFKEATDRFQSNGVTSSIVLNAVFDLQNRLMKHQCQFFDTFRNTLLAELDKNSKGKSRFRDLMKDERFVIASILDPRYKLRLFAPKTNRFFETLSVNEAIAKIQDVFDNLSNRDEKVHSQSSGSSSITASKGMFSFLDELESPEIPTIRSELDTYLEEPTLPAFYIQNDEEKETDILKYWRENKFRFPTLFEMVKIYLSIPASSGDVERLFSIAGTLKRHQRNRLSLKQTENILTIKYHHLNKKSLNLKKKT